MSMQQTITEKLTATLTPSHLEVINESDNHNVPPGSESHFKLVVVSEEFDGQTLLGRHRRINGILADELQGGIHALAIHAYSPQEWADKNARSPESPPCLGGGRNG